MAVATEFNATTALVVQSAQSNASIIQLHVARVCNLGQWIFDANIQCQHHKPLVVMIFNSRKSDGFLRRSVNTSRNVSVFV